MRAEYGSSRSGAPSIIRVYDWVRTAHLERLAEMSEGLLIYINQNYDFDPSAAPAHARVTRMTRAAAAREIFRASGCVTVEINEPTAWASWKTHLSLLPAIHLRRLLRRQTNVIAYCIDNADPVDYLVSSRLWPRWFAWLFSRVMVNLVVRTLDRVAFGTEDSYRNYRRICGESVLVSHGRQSALFHCLSPKAKGLDVGAPKTGVIFVGALDRRKGILELLEAWPSVVGLYPGARLSILGKGELAEEIVCQTAADSSIELVIDPSREQISASLLMAKCLVLYSQPVEGWREQIGLPILEALSAGCEVVASDQTGLADWLRQTGHTVVASDASVNALATAVCSALRSKRSVSELVSFLPEVDGRLAADEWLLDESLCGCFNREVAGDL